MKASVQHIVPDVLWRSRTRCACSRVHMTTGDRARKAHMLRRNRAPREHSAEQRFWWHSGCVVCKLPSDRRETPLRFLAGCRALDLTVSVTMIGVAFGAAREIMSAIETPCCQPVRPAQGKARRLCFVRASADTKVCTSTSLQDDQCSEAVN